MFEKQKEGRRAEKGRAERDEVQRERLNHITPRRRVYFGVYFGDTENSLEGFKQGDEKETDYLPFKEATPIAKWG